MNRAILYETLLEVHNQKENEAWQSYCDLSSRVDVSSPFKDIALEVSRFISVPLWHLNDIVARLRHSFESYPFEYTIISDGDRLFPKDLEGIHFLYAYGDVGLLEKDGVGVLGMRQPSQSARTDAVSIVKELGEIQRPVIGTLDTGLDAYTMMYALNCRMPQILVLASPLHQCMPEGQKDLMVSIANSGTNLLISPFPPSSRAQKWFTVPRNRLLVSLARTLVIVEEKDGGPLWRLASLALEQGKQLVIASSCVANPSYSYAQNYASRPSVALYKKKGDLKKLFGIPSRKARKSSDDSGQLELF